MLTTALYQENGSALFAEYALARSTTSNGITQVTVYASGGLQRRDTGTTRECCVVPSVRYVTTPG